MDSRRSICSCSRLDQTTVTCSKDKVSSWCSTVAVALVTVVTPAQPLSNGVFTIQPATEPRGRAAQPSGLGPLTTWLCFSCMIRGSQTVGQTGGHIVCGVEPSDASPLQNVRNTGAVSEAACTYCLYWEVAGSIPLVCPEFLPLHRLYFHSQTTGTSTTSVITRCISITTTS